MPSRAARWLRDRKRVASGVVVALVVGTIVTLSLNYEGVATADVELNDGGVWVSNESSILVGRLNYPVREIDATLAADTPDIDLLQREDDVLLLDPGAGLLRRIDTANVQFAGSSVAIPAGAEVGLGKAAVAVLDPADGRLWVTAPTSLSVIEDTTVEPTYTVGEGAHMAIGDDGTVHVLDVVDNEFVSYAPEVWQAAAAQASAAAEEAEDGETDGEPTTGEDASEPASPSEEATPEISVLPDEIDLMTSDVQVTAVGDRAVALAYEPQDGTLTLLQPGRDPVDLSGLDVDLGSARLQAASRSGDVVAFATTDAVVLVPLTGGDARVVPTERPGPPAQPVQVSGCVHSAWSGDVPTYLRVCGNDEAAQQPVPQAAIGAELVFRVNRDRVVLNDLQTGNVWMLEDRLYLVQNWEEVISSDAEDEETEDPSEQETDEVPLDREAENRDPVAEPDALAGRPGRTVVLPVLVNDKDPDGDLLTVATFEQPAASFGVVEPILGGRALQIRLAAGATGQVVLGYGISDGRGGKDTATVTIDVRPESQNSPPEQLKPIEADVVAGEAVEVNVLNDVRDPDGDEVYLVSGQANDTMGVTVRPDGLVTVRDLGISTGKKQVVVEVTDGRGGEPSQVTLDIEVLPDSAVAPQAVFDFATGFLDEPIEVEPLVNDVDPNGKPLQLAIVTPTNGGEVTTDIDKGTFSFVGRTAGTYYLTYVVTDDDGLNAEGLVRVDVLKPNATASPIAVSDTALLPPDGTVTVDAIDNDTDPAGGVLAVQSIDVPQGYGMQVAILDHRVLRITSERTLAGPVTIGYTVSNGTESAEGEIAVVPLSGQTQTQPPVPNPDSASVRVGDHVTVPVLRNDTHPNGLDFHVTGIETPEGTPGLAFVSQDLVRYAAPDEPGTYKVTYTVTDTNGQSDSAVLTIYVEARGEEVNAPPVPADIEVRAFAGERIRIPVDIYGIDPDGDSVQLVGPTTSPDRGRIVDVQAGYIDYVAYNAAEGGTDTFDFAVRDRLGAMSTATVTIGVIPPPSSNRSPVTASDSVDVRPDRDIQVDVLLNDTDPDGDQLTFADPAVVDAGGLDVAVDEGLLTFTSPSEEGDYTVLYKADDTHGGQDVGSLTVTVDAEAPFVPPVAVDDLVPATDLVEATEVQVDVLDNDYDPDGSSDDLTVALPVVQDGVSVLDDGRLSIAVLPHRQVVTYQVTDPDGETTYAFVEVPGTEDTGPVLVLDEELEVNSGEELLIDLTDYVVSLTGRSIRLYDNDGVTATNSDGGPYVVDGTTLRFVSAPGYAGPASITFSVTDFADINAADVISSVLTIPIRVIATTDQPPTFRNGSMDVEAGGDPVSMDIGRLAADVDTEVADLTFTLGAVPAGFSASLENGVVLTASADLDTPRGTTVDLPVQVSDGVNPPVDGVITLTATGSTAPLIVANDDDIGEVHQGDSVTVPVLENDTNPFEGEPRTITDAFVETGSGSVSIQGESLVVTPGADYVGRFVVVYGVQDATGEPERRQEARVTATVLGAPETPARPGIESVGDSEVVVDITPPNDNGSPITSYEVTASGGPTVTCQTTTCRVGGLTNDVTYTFTVVAINAVGPSEPSAPSAEARPDVAPGPVAAPSVTFGDTELALAWTEPVNNGSDIVAYDVQISPMAPNGTSQVRLDAVTGYTWEGLTNGTTYRFRIRAVNDAPDPGDWGDWSRPEYPSGPPAQPAAPSMVRIDNPAGGQVQASWTAPDDNGDSIDVYHVTLYRDGAAYRTVDVAGGTLTRLFDVENGHDYSVSVIAENRSGPSQASPQSPAVTSFGAPGQVTGVRTEATGASGQIRVTYGTPSNNGQAIDRFEYRLSSGGSGTLGASPATIGGLSNGTSYTIQVRACNTYCGEWSAVSNASAPYGPPARPPSSGSISSSASGKTVSFSWSYPASSNGAAITAVQIQVDGSTRSESRTGTATATGDWEELHTFQMRVQNEHGQWSDWSAVRERRAEADPTPPVILGVDRGGTVTCEQGGGTCRYVILTYQNLPQGTYDATFTTNSTNCSHGRSYTLTLGGNGSYTTTAHYGTSCNGTITWRLSGSQGTFTGTDDW